MRQQLRQNPQEFFRIQSSAPGKVFEDLIILRSATGEGDISPPADIRPFDVRSGKLVWQFHTIPHPGEYGYHTWPKAAWRYVGDVNAWGEMTIDEERGIVDVPLGSPTYDFYGADLDAPGQGTVPPSTQREPQ
ncbi:MAG: hypothetical protein GEV06_26585 [Luteitalea sp.]|nr:hypothetical protein [Luteitalea sp.]